VLDQRDGAFCDAAAAVAWFREYLPAQRWEVFKPGDSVELHTGRITLDPVSAEFDFSDESRPDYLARYAVDRADEIAKVYEEYPEPAPGPGFAERFARHFEHLGGLSDYFLSQIDMLVRFQITGAGGGTWDVRLSPGRVQVTEADPQAKPHYRITTRSRWVDAVLTGRMAWEDLLISFRLNLYRDPDVYNDYLVGLLKHANAPALRAVEEYETGRDRSERIVVRSDGVAYDIPRYCPHAGEDLSVGAVVTDGRLLCLAHNFTFDLATGDCVNARCENLTSRPIADPDARPVPGPDARPVIRPATGPAARPAGREADSTTLA
jgi:UDP-MurNAc hydroxylase